MMLGERRAVRGGPGAGVDAMHEFVEVDGAAGVADTGEEQPQIAIVMQAHVRERRGGGPPDDFALAFASTRRRPRRCRSFARRESPGRRRSSEPAQPFPARPRARADRGLPATGDAKIGEEPIGLRHLRIRKKERATAPVATMRPPRWRKSTKGCWRFLSVSAAKRGRGIGEDEGVRAMRRCRRVPLPGAPSGRYGSRAARAGGRRLSLPRRRSSRCWAWGRGLRDWARGCR